MQTSPLSVMTAVFVCVCVCVGVLFSIPTRQFSQFKFAGKGEGGRRQITPEGEHLLHYTARKLLSDFAVFAVIAELYVT